MEADRPLGRGAAHPLWPLFVLVVGAAVLVLVLAHPAVDESWENHPAHFWLVLTAAAINVALGYAVGVAARRRRDARLFLVSLAFVSAAGLPRAACARDARGADRQERGLRARDAGRARGRRRLRGGLGISAASARGGARPELGLAAHRQRLRADGDRAAISLAEVRPLAGELGTEQLDGWQITLAAIGVVLYTAAAIGYYRLYRRRGAPFLLGIALAFALLAEAMLVIAWARNWRVSWWEWHLLMLVAFVTIAISARTEWHEERFSPLYLDETIAGTREVSVLFADLQGFTSYAEQTSPARVAAMLNGYYGRLVPLLEAEGGVVHQIIGDAVMVIFNQNGDQPDHAARAAHTALSFQAAAAQLADAHPEWPRFRAAVNSGEALAGLVGGPSGHRKHGVVGDTVNLAARLEAQAPVGGVVIGAETSAALPTGAVVERLPPLEVKGKDDPVEAYLLHHL